MSNALRARTSRQAAIAAFVPQPTSILGAMQEIEEAA